jgi:hypothetical protein
MYRWICDVCAVKSMRPLSSWYGKETVRCQHCGRKVVRETMFHEELTVFGLIPIVVARFPWAVLFGLGALLSGAVLALALAAIWSGLPMLLQGMPFDAALIRALRLAYCFGLPVVIAGFLGGVVLGFRYRYRGDFADLLGPFCARIFGAILGIVGGLAYVAEEPAPDRWWPFVLLWVCVGFFFCGWAGGLAVWLVQPQGENRDS